MTFAIIQTGGKQHRVSEGQTLKIEKLPKSKVGEKVTFDKVLLIDDGRATSVGTPYVSGASVTATLSKEGRARKVVIQKFKSKSNYHKKQGHRHHYAEIKIEKISA